MPSLGTKTLEYQYQPLNKPYHSGLAEGSSNTSSAILVEEYQLKSRRARISILWVILLASISSIFGLLSTIYFVQSGVSSISPPLAGPQLQESAPKVTLTHCGTTPEEARARGCKFEVHNFAWVPPECFDEELAAEWDADPSWTFSRTRTSDPLLNPPNLYTREEGDSGDLESAILPWRQHIAHCAVVVRKFQRAVMLERPMDNWTSSSTHMTHCTRNFLEWDIEPWDYNSVLHLKFPICDFSWRDGVGNSKGEQGKSIRLHDARIEGRATGGERGV